MSHKLVTKIAIVGAGPAGGAAAAALAQRGISDVLLLDRGELPRDKTCGSALSPATLGVLRGLGLRDEVERLGYPARSLLLTTPAGRSLHLHTDQGAIILLRRHFDELLVRRATSRGVGFTGSFRATELIRHGPRVRGVRGVHQGRPVEVAADVVLCADGGHSVFSADPRPKPTIVTVMGWWEEFPFEPHTLEMIFDRRLSPLYGWMFPETADRVNIGICIDRERLRRCGGNVRDVFAGFLHARFRERLRNARQVGGLRGHPIAYTPIVRNLTAPGALYVGEAARLTNSATGEGIFQAVQSGIYAGHAAADVVQGVRGEEEAWRRYRAACRKRFTSGLVGGLAVRAAVRGGLLDAAAMIFGDPRLRRLATRVVGSGLTGTHLPPSEST
ncbi:NAD(P)/FAD-dependent oxidoreductase [Nonomuraea sp. PA05]|uniref:NAD(P)/FAD-dependent oxidoreductase n=1 Tax=Nonomuraea sp. PA05 TaxID=2604466 RepID=UPI0011D34E81|nr:NAD(P)/FAD-dependent oxidoreductase [Nonomuraea sp. PA05]TYB50775.1 NAD(P)/FAD-dependent oxidoreductase [Nonomuraea sp. PA05]